MSDLYEVVFEDVPKRSTIPLLMSLIKDSHEILNVECSEDFRVFDGTALNIEGLNSVLDFKGSVCTIISLDEMRWGDLAMQKVLIRVVKYDEQYDIDFTFYFGDAKNLSSDLKRLHENAKRIAADHSVAACMSGLEPASNYMESK